MCEVTVKDGYAHIKVAVGNPVLSKERIDSKGNKKGGKNMLVCSTHGWQYTDIPVGPKKETLAISVNGFYSPAA